MIDLSMWRRCVVACMLTGTLSCGADSTTKPGSPSLPTITGVTPASITATPSAQAITVVGNNFGNDPTLILTPPGGIASQFSGQQLLSLGPTSISVSTAIAMPGAWQVQVKTAAGVGSNVLTFSVVRAPAPNIQTVSPSQFDIEETARVSVTGTGFQPGLSVVLSGVDFDEARVYSAASISNLSPTSFSFSTISTTTQSYDVTVINPDGQSSPRAGRISIGPPFIRPTITAVTPSPLGVAPFAQVVTITGTGFRSGSTVQLLTPDGKALSAFSVTVLDQSTIQVFVTLNLQGTWPFRVINFDGGFAAGSLNVGPALPNPPPPPPTISASSLAGLTAADSQQTVTVLGTGFQPGLGVTVQYLGGAATPSTVLSSTATTIQIASALTLSGPWMITVRNPNGAFSTALVQVGSEPDRVPVVTNVQPSALLSNFAEQVLTLTGSGFGENLSVSSFIAPPADLNVPMFNTYTAVVPLSSTKAQLHAMFDHAGTWRFQLRNGLLRSDTITVAVSNPATPAPSITSLDPAQPYATQASQAVTLNGTNFQQGLRVLLVEDDSTRTSTPNNLVVDSVTTTSLRLSGQLLTTGRLQVQNPDGRVSNIVRFTRKIPPPHQCAVSNQPVYVASTPQTIRVICVDAQAGATLTLFDSLGGVRSVSNLSAQPSVFIGSTAFTFTALIDVVGWWKVRVTNPDGQTSNDARFWGYAPAPTLTSVVPVAPQSEHEPQLLTVVGTGFQSGLYANVGPPFLSSFPSVAGQSFVGPQIQNLTATSFQIAATLYLAGQWTISFHNPDGQGASKVLTVVGAAAPPTITAITASSSVALDVPRAVTVTGSGFHYPIQFVLTPPSGPVWQQSGSASDVVNLTLSGFEFVLTPHRSGTWTLAVVNMDGQQSNTTSFVVP